ncbi:MAG: SurA N-terminal domain-containing protein [Methylophilaceae bacterium]|nr:SurA N-terminal domain-containing protein [Methylophilaceae bacterium]
MLETIRERSQSWIAKLILALITVPFALWGIDSYLREAGSNVAVAKVDGQSITAQQFARSLQEWRDSLMKGNSAPNAMDTPELRSAVLERLINTRLLAAEAKRGGYAISDDQLAKFVVSMPEFQKNGRFSQEVYDQVLMANGLTPSQFEARMREELLIQQVQNGIAGLAFVPHAVADVALRSHYQRREISVFALRPEDYLAQTQIKPEESKAYYDQHPDEFRVPEQVKLEFLVFSVNNLIPSMQVSDEEARKFYEENASKFQEDEERHARHILITYGNDKAVARKKAEAVLAEVRKSPENFAALAKKYSQDPGSADKGGDLGPIKRGLMVKPFEDAVFAMTPGSISDLVETEFGYHIIQVTEVKGGGQTFETLRPQIRAELMYQKALAKFAEAAETFSNTVYEQSSSLEPAAQAHGLQVQKTDWVSRQDIAKFFRNDKLAAAVFSTEVLKDKRNTEAVEISPNTLAAARVTDYRPSSIKPFETVRATIEDKLKRAQAIKLAQQQGEKTLEALKKGEAVKLEWTTPVMADRANPQGLTEQVVAQAFRMDARRLPTYGSVSAADGSHVLVRLSAVEDGLQDLDADALKRAREDYVAELGAEYLAAFMNGLRSKASIKINRELLASKTQ